MDIATGTTATAITGATAIIITGMTAITGGIITTTTIDVPVIGCRRPSHREGLFSPEDQAAGGGGCGRAKISF